MKYQEQTFSDRDSGDVLKGLIAGAIGGLVASAVMNQFQKRISNVIFGDERAHGAQSLQRGKPRHGIGQNLEEKGAEDASMDAAERLATVVSVEVFDHELSEREKEIGGTAFHYAYGVSMGAVYGVAAEVLPQVTVGKGMPYGALIWVGADEGVVPLLGLSKSPAEYPLPIHVSALAAHLVYGLTTEFVRRTIRNAL